MSGRARITGTTMCVAMGALALCLIAGCTTTGDDFADDVTQDTEVTVVDIGDPGDCITVDMAVSPEKITLLTELAREFNESDQAELDGECVFVRPARKASGGAEQLLAQGWPDPDTNGPAPVVWSPSSNAWGPVLNAHLAERGLAPMATAGTPFMLTPLVIAMPQPMADALGYPDTEIGFADILRLSQDPDGWASFGHPEWGPFRLGKTNPNFSTSGLHFTIAEYYAATGKTRDLTLEDLDRRDVEEYATAVESAVVHYGDTTLTFLNNWYRADARGTTLTYASAAAVEEKSVLDYNAGNPDGILDAGEAPRAPRIPLVAVYPKEGTLYSDNPFIILDASWVNDEQKQAAKRFEAFVQQPENQQKVLEFGFRPGSPEVAIGSPIVVANGVDPDQPQTLLEVPDGEVMAGILDKWAEQRKAARVLLVIDISGSMGDPATDDGFETKLDLAKQAAIDALDEFKDDDLVGLRVFSTDLGSNEDQFFLDLLPLQPIGPNRESVARRIRDLFPTNATPLYDVIAQSYADMVEGYDDELINAIVLLTDGVNDDGEPDDDFEQLTGLLGELQVGSEGGTAKPVRIFPIAYGETADLDVLKQVAEATNAAAYDASDPASINRVFTAVVSNF